MTADFSVIALEERVDQIIPKLSRTRASALHQIREGKHFDLHLREISGLEAWDLIETSKIYGEKRPHSAWLTDLGKAALTRLENRNTK